LTEQQDDYNIAKEAIQKAIMPIRFVSLDKFHCRRLRPSEAISVFTHNLKKLLDQAVTTMNREAETPFYYTSS